MKRSQIIAVVFLCCILRPVIGNAQGLPTVVIHDTQVSGSAGRLRATPNDIPTERVAGSSSLRLIAPTSGPGLVINATFDTSITSNINSTAIQNAINAALSVLQSRFKDSITVSIYFRYATTQANGVTPLSGGTLAQSQTVVYTSFTWAQYITPLQADSKTANDVLAIANLPVAPLSANVLISPPTGRAIGLNTPGVLDSVGNFTGSFDGIVTLNSAQPFAFTRPATGGNFDTQRTIEHEVDEVLGLGSYLPNSGSIRPEDMFSYSAPAVRNILSTGTRYLSIDGGLTNLVGLNQDPGGDFGDFLSGPCPQVTPFVQNAFGCAAQSSDVTATSPEAVALDAIGYDLVTNITGDFSGDGKPDIVLRNYSTGQNALWVMNGTSLSSIIDLPALANTAWHIEGTGDFNGDGKNDIVLRNYTTGQNALWIMNGTSLTSIIDLPLLANTAYHFAGVGDFNADGKPDIILRNFTTGQNALWLMNGTALSSVVDLPALPNTAYHIESCGDFNGDGKTDIVLRNYTTGQNALWLMNGTSLTSTVDLPALPNTAFHFNGVGDFNADNKPDIVLRNYTTGQDALWVMNGTSLSTVIDLPALPNTNFEFDGPR